MKTLWILANICALFIFSAAAATAGLCATPFSHEAMVKVLSDRYNETRTGIGLSGQVIIVETFRSKAGTWTILATTPDRKSCIIAAGGGWTDVEPEPAGMKS